MAAVRKLSSLLGIRSSASFWYIQSSCNRLYSVFAPDFTEPVLNKNEINKIMENKSKEDLLAIRIKPALNSQTCSVFYHPDVEILTNYIMKCGNRKLSKELVRNTFTRIKHIQVRKYNSEKDEEKKKNILISPLEVFLLAVKNVSPLLWYVRIKKSGSWYKVPIGISEEKARRRAMKWLIEVANEKGTKVPFDVQFANELLAASQYQGKAVAKKLELHKMCEANRGYIHYWWT